VFGVLPLVQTAAGDRGVCRDSIGRSRRGHRLRARRDVRGYRRRGIRRSWLRSIRCCRPGGIRPSLLVGDEIGIARCAWPRRQVFRLSTGPVRPGIGERSGHLRARAKSQTKDERGQRQVKPSRCHCQQLDRASILPTWAAFVAGLWLARRRHLAVSATRRPQARSSNPRTLALNASTGPV
jgi:hypothetical protein